MNVALPAARLQAQDHLSGIPPDEKIVERTGECVQPSFTEIFIFPKRQPTLLVPLGQILDSGGVLIRMIEQDETMNRQPIDEN